ncbi:hypothetical protein E1A91_D06G081200v1 [Gossypium mustelinum]|uniref:Uncharacterized protein n=1 Tax=Gossypium mustelinum TaxID=34275 RepID=A0A5D2UGV7_GOSMU|nr:hypothetical protein E1A91_D06G081200v1 [Gossypium mustelinum]
MKSNSLIQLHCCCSREQSRLHHSSIKHPINHGVNPTVVVSPQTILGSHRDLLHISDVSLATKLAILMVFAAFAPMIILKPKPIMLLVSQQMLIHGYLTLVHHIILQRRHTILRNTMAPKESKWVMVKKFLSLTLDPPI